MSDFIYVTTSFYKVRRSSLEHIQKYAAEISAKCGVDGDYSIHVSDVGEDE